MRSNMKRPSRRCVGIGSVAVLCAVLTTGAVANAASEPNTPPPPALTDTPHSTCPAPYSGTQLVRVTANATAISNPGPVVMCDHIINDNSSAAVRAKEVMTARANEAATRKKAASKAQIVAEANAATPIGIEPYPSYCPTSNGAVYTFDDMCTWQDHQIILLQVNTGAVVGTMEYFWRDYSYWERSLLDIIHQIQVSPYAGSAEGAKPGVWQVVKGNPAGCSVTTPAGVTCKLGQEDFTSPQKVAIETKSAVAAASFVTTYASGSESLLGHYIQWGVEYIGSDKVSEDVDWENDYPITYCDNNLPGVKYGGCKAPTDKWAPTYSLSLKTYPTLARAIRDVQAKGAPGARSSGHWLTRTTNESIQNSNRATACPSSWKPPSSSYSCDEYPGASTYEGAAYNPSSGITFSYCKNPYLSQTTPSPKWESCYVPATEENSSEGGLRNSFWVTYRTLDNDRFWEAVTS